MLHTELRKYIPFEDIAFAQLISHDTRVQALALWIILSLKFGHTALKIENGEIFPPLQELVEELPQEFLQTLQEEAYQAVQLSETPLTMMESEYRLSSQCRYSTLPSIAECERKSLLHIQRLMNAPKLHSAHVEDSSLNEEQLHAVRTALRENITLVAGGPGTGKTYTVGRLLHAYCSNIDARTIKIVLAAPTGKAAVHLEKSLQKAFSGQIPFSYEVKTLHALTLRNESLHAHVVIVDECSMIDLKMFEALLSKVPCGTKLILLGDPDQLPPVGVGSPFAAFLNSAIPSVRLRTCQRTTLMTLTDLASSLRVGDRSFFELLRQHKAVEDGPLGWYDLQEETLLTRFQGVGKKADESTLILSPKRLGPFGVSFLNDIAQPFFFKTPILITQNDWNLGVTNGEIGFKERKMRLGRMREYFVQEDRDMPLSLLPAYEPAYALSIHKSQGSEADRVLIVLPEGSDRFGWKLLYTALTRAKKRVEIFASEEVLLKTYLNRQESYSTLPLQMAHFALASSSAS